MTGILNILAGSIASAIKDGYFNLVTLLLPGNGTNGAQNNTFLDSSTNNFTITRNGNTTQGTFSPFSQTGWGNYFSGGANALTVASNAAFDFAGNATVELWVYFTGNMGARQDLIHHASNGFEILKLSGDTIYCGFGGGTITSSTTVVANQWYHIALVRSSTGTNGLNLYINGSNVGSATAASSVTSGTMAIGAQATGNSPITGYISNLRITKNGALYTSTFTPSTTPLTTTVSSGTVSLLTCQSNRFVDNSSNSFALTVVGSPSVQAFSPFAPTAAYSATDVGGSGYFDGNGDYLTITNSSNLNPGTGDFTFEFWAYWFGTGTASSIFEGKSNGLGVGLQSGKMAVTYSYNAVLITDPSNFPKNTWTHVAATRSGTTLTLWINGVSVVSATNSTNFVTSTTNSIGWTQNTTTSDQYFDGYISGIRFLKGTAQYTTTFTPPTAPPTDITNTQLLCNFTNAGITDATAKNDLETVGNAQISTTQSKFGGSSMYFDGTGDWLTVIDNPNLQMGSGDFTIEGWFYLSATGVAYGIVSKGTSTTGWSVNITSGNKLQFSYTSSNLTGATTLSSATWYYFAVVRSGTATGNLKIYLNGSADATSAGAVTDNFNQTSIMYVGADRVGTSALNGYIDDLRITKGYARTIATPSSAFALQ